MSQIGVNDGNIWILSRYSRFNFEDNTWNTLDNSKCISPITIQVTSSSHLMINYENEIQECINLWNSKDTRQGIYKDMSIMDNGASLNSQSSTTHVASQNFNGYAIPPSTPATQTQTVSQKEVKQKQFIQQNPNSNTKQIFTHKQMAEILLKKHQRDLPLIFLNSQIDDCCSNETDDSDKNALKEFIMHNLLDQNFVHFVESVDTVLNELMFNEIQNN